MASKTEICNLALGHLGQGKIIADIDTDQSIPGVALRLFYDYALETTLRDLQPIWAKRTAALAKVANDPTPYWAYSYRYPADCLMILRIPSGVRVDTQSSRVPYEQSSDVNGLLIMTSQAEAYLEYITLLTKVQLYPADFSIALSHLLASLTAPQITTGDNFNLAEKNMRLYQLWASRATANAANETQSDQEPDSEFDRARY